MSMNRVYLFYVDQTVSAVYSENHTKCMNAL